MAAKNQPSDGWKERIIIPTLLAGVAGGGAGWLLRHRTARGGVSLAANYAANLAIVTGCFCVILAALSLFIAGIEVVEPKTAKSELNHLAIRLGG